MRLTGNAKAEKLLRGKINGLETIKGYSAYEIALIHGFEGTEEEWLDSLNGGLITVDKQLYRSGHAADAKVTGEKIDELAAKIGDTENYLSDRITTEKAERQAEIAIESARITNLATLEEGSTTGDAELIDIRVGADGKTYANAGEAVRSQALLNETILNQGNVKDALTKIQYYLKSAVFTDLRDTANFEPINNPAISPDWILTPGESGDVKSPVALDTTGTWEIKTRVYVPTTFAGYGDIMATVNDDGETQSGAIIECQSNSVGVISFGLYVKIDGTNKYAICSVAGGQWADIRAGFTGSKYFIELTPETGTAALKEISNTGITPTGKYPVFGRKVNGYYKEKIDLSKTEMIVNGETVWRAVV